LPAVWFLLAYLSCHQSYACPKQNKKRQKLNNLQRRSALKWQLEIEDEYISKRDEQRLSNGLVIIEAKYGNTLNDAPVCWRVRIPS
jgi:hypothetical protein